MRHDIEMQDDGEMKAEAVILIPTAVKQIGGRVGVIFGNYANNAGDSAINFEVHLNGQLRVFWSGGSPDIYGKTDLRDGLQHTVGFTRTRESINLYVDGNLEATGAAGADVLKRKQGTFVGHDWRKNGGMAFRGDILYLKINNKIEIISKSDIM